MASAGPNSPGTIVNDNSVGLTAWVNPGNAASSNNAYATNGVEGDFTNTLKATNFGFAIPSDATVDGIEVTIERKAGTAGVKDSGVFLIREGVAGGTNRAKVPEWSTSETVETYGGATDLWGGTWTPSQINASTSGVGLNLGVNSFKTFTTASVDHITITVYYTDGGGGGGFQSAWAINSNVIIQGTV